MADELEQRPYYPCKACGGDIGWDAPSGVCSTECLRAIERPRETILEFIERLNTTEREESASREAERQAEQWMESGERG